MELEKAFNQHIQHLLMRHECVIVPGLGGFIVYKQNAQIINNSIYPPMLSIRFNSLLDHNDGLLCEMYMAANKLSYQNALDTIKATVQQILHTLHTNKKYTIDNVGDLVMHEDGTISIECLEATFIPSNYGLHKIKISPINKHNNNTKIISFQLPYTVHQTLKYAAAIIIVSLITLLIPSKTNINEYHASLSIDTIKKFDNKTLNKTDNDLTLPLKSESNINNQDTDTTKQSITSNNATTKEIPTTNKKTKQYYIIIASLTSQEQAERYIKEQHKPKTLKIIHEKDKFRIASNCFNTYNEAINHIDSIRQTPKGKHAWVMCKKN